MPKDIETRKDTSFFSASRDFVKQLGDKFNLNKFYNC